MKFLKKCTTCPGQVHITCRACSHLSELLLLLLGPWWWLHLSVVVVNKDRSCDVLKYHMCNICNTTIVPTGSRFAHRSWILFFWFFPFVKSFRKFLGCYYLFYILWIIIIWGILHKKLYVREWPEWWIKWFRVWCRTWIWLMTSFESLSPQIPL